MTHVSVIDLFISSDVLVLETSFTAMTKVLRFVVRSAMIAKYKVEVVKCVQLYKLLLFGLE